MSSVPPSLRSRALLAVGLTVAFYALTLAIAAALIGGPIVLWATTGAGNPWIAIAMISAGVAVLRAAAPPRDEFDAPGPELTRDEHPALHAELDAVARDAGAQPADVVYLDLALNAAVLERRRQRIMLLGLPLLATLSRDELRAVVAHEYGHFTGGDTRFGTWIWRTRASVLRTVQELANSGGFFRRNLIRWPFEGYARLFLRITNALSRRAEYAADAVAARVASPEAAGRALRRISALDPAYDAFWSGDVVPMLEAQRRPAIAQGFQAAERSGDLSGRLDKVLEADLAITEAGAYASHPTLRQRLEALGQPADPAAPDPAEEPVLGLLDDVPGLERRLLVQRFGTEVEGFEAGSWESAVDLHVARVEHTWSSFGGAVPRDLSIGGAGAVAEKLADLRPPLYELLPDGQHDVPGEDLDRLAFDLLAGGVFLAAMRAGAQPTARPGEPLLVEAEGLQLDPWAELAPIALGEQPVSTWQDHALVQRFGGVRLHDEDAPSDDVAVGARRDAAHPDDQQRGEGAPGAGDEQDGHQTAPASERRSSDATSAS